MPYADPIKQAEYQRQWVARLRAEWFAANGPCVCCGSTEDLQLDHKDPKLKVSHRVWSWSTARRETELAKCQVLCRPCHAAKTKAYRRERVQHGTGTMRYRIGCDCKKCREYVRDQKRRSRARLAEADR